MIKSIYRILPFILMIVVVMGSEVLSCNTLPGTKHGSGGNSFSLNTGKNEEGRIFTTWVLREIQSTWDCLYKLFTNGVCRLQPWIRNRRLSVSVYGHGQMARFIFLFPRILPMKSCLIYLSVRLLPLDRSRGMLLFFLFSIFIQRLKNRKSLFILYHIQIIVGSVLDRSKTCYFFKYLAEITLI